MARRAWRRHRKRRGRTRPLPDRTHDRTGARGRDRHSLQRHHRIHQHHSGRPPAEVPRQSRSRTEDPQLHPLERHGHGRARQQEHQRRRPHRLLRLGRRALRRRLLVVLARALRAARRRPDLLPGPRRSRHLRARAHARPPDRRTDGQLPPGSRRQGHSVLSAPLADARLLAVPDRFDGPRPAAGDLRRALHEIHGQPRFHSGERPQGVGLPRRRRDRRGRIARRHRHGRAREARQPDLRHQLQPAATGRPSARQRQDHPGPRIRIPRRRLERHQAGLGNALGRAVGARQEGHPEETHDGMRRRRVPDLQGEERRLRARILLQHAGTQGTRCRLDRRRRVEPQPRRPRHLQDLHRLQGGRRTRASRR